MIFQRLRKIISFPSLNVEFADQRSTIHCRRMSSMYRVDELLEELSERYHPKNHLSVSPMMGFVTVGARSRRGHCARRWKSDSLNAG